MIHFKEDCLRETLLNEEVFIIRPKNSSNKEYF